MNIGIIGLGLIGGSFAKAYKAAGHTVYARDIDQSILDFAILSGAVDAILEEDALQRCALLLLAVYPQTAIETLHEIAPDIPSTSIVIDCCGTKKSVCQAGFEVAEQYGFTFVGGHPMAGTEQSGFKFSKGDLFRGASMILVPPVYDDIQFLDRIKQLLDPAGFGRMTVTTAEEHDRVIAFTSQMAHLVSNAFIKSPVVQNHEGFSAGSYQDLTRVAWLNEQMWAELFMENRENLLAEVDFFLDSLCAYKDALINEDFGALRSLLYDGKRIKEEVDRR